MLLKSSRDSESSLDHWTSGGSVEVGTYCVHFCLAVLSVLEAVSSDCGFLCGAVAESGSVSTVRIVTILIFTVERFVTMV